MPTIKNFIKQIIQATGFDIKRTENKVYADASKLEKGTSYVERYREIVSDPINILIKRVPEAGYVDKNDCVILHNGHRVPVAGHLAYYRDFSDILIINRGVHEPLEEYCFQEMLRKIKSESPKMIELGSYWAHYSMWLMKEFPKANCYMVEPEQRNKKCGENNFTINGYKGEFIKSFVGSTSFQLDAFTSERNISSLDVLHADIQGYELEMLQGGQSFLTSHRANYVFISTHSETLHSSVVEKLKEFGYRIEVSSEVSYHTTSGDGFVLASSPKVSSIFRDFSPLGRRDIAISTPQDLINSLNSILR